MDFVFATASLRMCCYGLVDLEPLSAHRIALRIVPAVSTTTAAVAGLVTAELIKIAVSRSSAPSWPPSDAKDLAESERSHLRFENSFVDLGETRFVFSEPMEPEYQQLPSGTRFSEWDMDEMRQPNAILQDIVDFVRVTIHLGVTGILLVF